MTKEKSLSSMKFTRVRRYANRASAKKIRQIEHLLMKSQQPIDILPLLISAILRPKVVLAVMSEYDERQQGGFTQCTQPA